MFPRVRLALRLGSVATLLVGLLLIVGARVTAQQPGGEPAEAPAAESSDPSAAPGDILLLTVQDAISPATSHYIQRGIEQAEESGAGLTVIELDTPGGLDSSMRDIIQAILASSVPVATYVWPQGARAASAGTYILYASHIAAMAPATNLGAATPVAIGGAPAAPDQEPQPGGGADEDGGTSRDGGGTAENGGSPEAGANDAENDDGAAQDGGEGAEDADTAPAQRAPAPSTASERKAVNDAVAYIRSLAERRDRNADWAERAVRSAESLSASAALELNVIDLIASDLDDLLMQIDGMTIEMPAGEVTLETAGKVVQRVEPDWRTKLLAVISNPTVAYMLMLIGIYGLIFEGYSPGAIVPGVVGAISLLLALFAFQILPVNYVGLGLILLGIILIIAEFIVPSFGALGFGGIAAFVLGSVILIDTDVPGFGIAMPLITAIATVGALTLFAVVWLAMRSRNRPVVSGNEQMTGAVASALEDFDVEGAVRVYGERWRARTSAPVRKGQPVRITRIEGLLLYVEPLEPDRPLTTSSMPA